MVQVFEIVDCRCHYKLSGCGGDVEPLISQAQM
jgi:hypothetical protein